MRLKDTPTVRRLARLWGVVSLTLLAFVFMVASSGWLLMVIYQQERQHDDLDNAVQLVVRRTTYLSKLLEASAGEYALRSLKEVAEELNSTISQISTGNGEIVVVGPPVRNLRGLQNDDVPSWVLATNEELRESVGDSIRDFLNGQNNESGEPEYRSFGAYLSQRDRRLLWHTEIKSVRKYGPVLQDSNVRGLKEFWVLVFEAQPFSTLKPFLPAMFSGGAGVGILLYSLFVARKRLGEREQVVQWAHRAKDQLKAHKREEDLLSSLPDAVRRALRRAPLRCWIYLPTKRPNIWRRDGGYGLPEDEETLEVDVSEDLDHPEVSEEDGSKIVKGTIVAKSVRRKEQVTGSRGEIPEEYVERGITNFIATPVVLPKPDEAGNEVIAVVGVQSRGAAPSPLDAELMRFTCELYATAILRDRARKNLEWKQVFAGVAHQVKSLLPTLSPRDLWFGTRRIPDSLLRSQVRLAGLRSRDVKKRMEWFNHVAGDRSTPLEQKDVVQEVALPAVLNSVLYHLFESQEARPLIVGQYREITEYFCAAKYVVQMLDNGEAVPADAHREFLDAFDAIHSSLAGDDPMRVMYRSLVGEVQFRLLERCRHFGRQSFFEPAPEPERVASSFYSGPEQLLARVPKELLQGCLEELLINALAAVARDYAGGRTAVEPYFRIAIEPVRIQHWTGFSVGIGNSGSPLPIQGHGGGPLDTDDVIYGSTGGGLRMVRYFFTHLVGTLGFKPFIEENSDAAIRRNHIKLTLLRWGSE